MQECKNRAAGSLEWKDGEGERERFEKWWYAQGYSGICRHDMDMSFKAWNARQPEIDTLNTQVNKLTDERTKLQAGIVALKAENEKLRKIALTLDAAAARLVDYFDEVTECAGRADYGKVYELVDKLEEAMPIHTDITAAMAPDTEAQLRKDAERYRWLRDQNVEPFVEDGETVFSVCAETEFDRERKWVGRDLDSVIDAAMTADTKGE